MVLSIIQQNRVIGKQYLWHAELGARMNGPRWNIGLHRGVRQWSLKVDRLETPRFARRECFERRIPRLRGERQASP